MLCERRACQSSNICCAICRTTSGGTASSPTSMVSLASTGERGTLAQSLTYNCVENVPSALLPRDSIAGISIHLCFATHSMETLNVHVYCSIVYMVGTDEESFEWLDVNKVPEEVRILQDTVNVLDLPRPPEVNTVQCLFS